jgi:hypothetical protein
VVTGFGGACLTVTEAQTETNVGDGSLSVSNMALDCGGGAAGAGAATDMLAADANAEVGDPGMVNQWMLPAASPLLDIGATPDVAFFDAVTYAGAFDDTTDWTTGWIETATE